jgi:hypothetical protein
MHVKFEKGNFLAIWQSYQVFVESLADFALKSSPDIRVDIWSLLLVLFAFKPLLNAFDMDVLYRTYTFAWHNQWAIFRTLVKTNPATRCLILVGRVFR